MARIVVMSGCYLGDVAPYVAPANLLAERGHDVTFLVPRGFHDALGGERFSLAPYVFDFSASAMRADPRHERLMRHPFRNQVLLARYWIDRGFGQDPAAARRCMLDVLDGADAVVGHPTYGFAVAPVAEHLDVPFVVGHLFPMMVPTREWGAPLLGKPRRSFGARANRVTWRLMESGSGWWMGDRMINEHRAALGCAPTRGNALLGWQSAARVVTMLSQRYFGPEASDWHGGAELVGFSHWAGPPRPLDPAIDAYLDDGDPPVLVCLGTSAAASGATFRTIAEQLDELGLRSLLLVGHDANLAAVADRDGSFTFAPISAVVARCRGAVVSGALGTLAAVLAAGRPVVVVPQLFDQVWHGQRVQQLGVGTMAWRATGVGRAMRTIEDDPSYADRARQLAAAMADEDGPTALADAVESVL